MSAYGECKGCSSKDDCNARMTGWNGGTCESGVCKASSCDIGYYVAGDKTCQANDNNNCGTLGKKCAAGTNCIAGECKGCSSKDDCNARMTGWNGGTCESGVCKASSCDIGYYVAGDKTCQANDNANCGTLGQKCAAGTNCIAGECKGCSSKDDCSARVAGWLDGSCIDGVCKASKCSAGFEWNSTAYTCDVITSCGTNEYYYNGSCQTSSATKCGSETNDCTKATGWASGKCTNNVCVATACESGYELSSGQCLLTSNYISCLGEWASDKQLTNMYHMDRNCNCLDNYMDADGDKSNGCESM